MMTFKEAGITNTTGATAPGRALGLPAQATLFLSLVAILLLPAWLNGFPFVMSDSIAYSGQGVNWMRSKTAAVAIAPLYRLLGYWALPSVNVVLAAAAWLALARVFHFGRLAFLAIPLAILALQPLYASAVIIDIWFFCAVAFGLGAMVWSSPLLALVTGILLSAHGSGILLFLPFAILAALVFRRPRFLVFSALAVGCAVAVTAALDMRYHPDQPRLEKTFFASRLFSAFPELLRDECMRSDDDVLCRGAGRVEALRAMPEHAGRRDFFWELTREFQPEFNLSNFESEHALPIILDALDSRPADVLGLVTTDFASFYAPDTTFDFLARPDETMPDGFARSAQAAGAMQSAVTERAASVARILLYLVTLSALLLFWRKAEPDAKRWIVLLLLLCLANDALFAILSGPPDRYHHRILGLLAATALIAFASAMRQRKPHMAAEQIGTLS
jgi:hypothetical protein